VSSLLAPESITLPKRAFEHEKVLSHELVLSALEPLELLIRRSRVARTLSAAIELQQELAQEAWAGRSRDRGLKAARAAVQREIRLAKQAGDSERLLGLGQEAERLRVALRANQRRRYAFRVVQDGIIWRALGFDRQVIATLGRANPVNYPSDSFPEEYAQAQEHWHAGRLALFCDISNCARSGDLIVLDPENQQTILHEVKERPDASPETRQMKLLQMKVAFLNSGRSEELEPGAPLLLGRSRPRLKTHLSALGDLLRQAEQRGWAVGRVGEHTSAFATDARGGDRATIEREFRTSLQREDRLVHQLNWQAADTYPYTSLHRIERDARNAFVATAPLSIFPLPAATCAALSLGVAAYRLTINLGHLRGQLQQAGWTVVPPDAIAEADKGFLLLARQGSLIRVPTTLADQLVVESLTFGAFRQMLEHVLPLIRDGGDDKVHVSMGWRQEERLWN